MIERLKSPQITRKKSGAMPIFSALCLMVRAASGLVIAVVVFKVFLFDMAALTGALRAASFLGLGAVLIVIGRLYQRLLMRGRAQAEPASS